MERTPVIGIRLSAEAKQRVANHAETLGIPQSSFIRVLINLSLEQIEKDPSILLRRAGQSHTSS
jgi:predicted DNA-binding protein